MANDSEALQTIKTGLQLGSEMLIPGGSNLIKGDIKQGAIHALLGFAARAYLGFPGLLLVSASSFSKAVTGKNLLEVIDEMGTKDKAESTATAVPASTPAAPEKAAT